MPSLGFSIDHHFNRPRAPRRRGLGSGIGDVDSLIARPERRRALERYVGAALLGAAIGAALALHGPIGALLHSLG